MTTTACLRALVENLGADALLADCLHVDTQPRGSGEHPGSITFRPLLCEGSIEIVRLDSLDEVADHADNVFVIGRVLFARLTGAAKPNAV